MQLQNYWEGERGLEPPPPPLQPTVETPLSMFSMHLGYCFHIKTVDCSDTAKINFTERGVVWNFGYEPVSGKYFTSSMFWTILRQHIFHEFQSNDVIKISKYYFSNNRSSQPKVFWRKGVLKICRQIYRRTPVVWFHATLLKSWVFYCKHFCIFSKKHFPRNTSGWLLLKQFLFDEIGTDINFVEMEFLISSTEDFHLSKYYGNGDEYDRTDAI